MSWFDIFIIVVVVLTLIKGAISGLIMQLISLLGIVLAAIFSGKLSAYIAPWLLRLTNANIHIISPLSYIIAFLVILIVVYLIGRLLHNVIKAVHMGTLNRIFGAVFCCVKWIFIVSVVLSLFIEFDQHHILIKDEVRNNSRTYPFVTKFSQAVIPYLSFNKKMKCW